MFSVLGCVSCLLKLELNFIYLLKFVIVWFIIVLMVKLIIWGIIVREGDKNEICDYCDVWYYKVKDGMSGYVIIKRRLFFF